jgi:hypothetical protein
MGTKPTGKDRTGRRYRDRLVSTGTTRSRLSSRLSIWQTDDAGRQGER